MKQVKKPTALDAKCPLWAVAVAILVAALLVWLKPIGQDATIAALAVAGKIPFQPSSVMGEYYFGTWTLLNQFGALALRFGLPQQYVDFSYGVLIVGANLVAYVTIINGFGAKPAFAIVAAIFCFFTGLLVQPFTSPDYPAGWVIWENPDHYTYGAAAYAGSSLVIGLLAGGRNFAAGLVSAVLIAVHPVVGAFVSGILLIGAVSCRVMMPSLRTSGLGKGFAAGLVIVIISFAVYWAMRPLPGNDIDAGSYRSYMEVWESHRVRHFRPGALVFVLIAALGPAAVLASPWRRSSPARLAALIALLSVAASGFLYVAFYFFRDFLPGVVVSAMPSRLISVHAAIAGAFAIGIAIWFYDGLTSKIGIRTIPPVGAVLIAAPWAALFLLALLVLPPSVLVSAQNVAAAGQPAGFSSLALSSDSFWVAVRKAHVTAPVLVAASASTPGQREGHLPVLLDVMGFDFVPYLPFTAHGVAQIVEQGYGISFADPPAKFERHQGGFFLSQETGRDYWQRLGATQWRDLADRLGFGAVLAPADWEIGLPAIASGPEFALYRVPPHEDH